MHREKLVKWFYMGVLVTAVTDTKHSDIYDILRWLGIRWKMLSD